MKILFLHGRLTLTLAGDTAVSLWLTATADRLGLHRVVRPGGLIWIFDPVESSIPAVQELMRRQYGEYLTGLKGGAYRGHVFAYVEREDTPRPLPFQLDLLRQVGFARVDVLHKNVCFAAFGGVKG